MGIVLRFPRHARISAGHKSGRNSERETPVSCSICSTNSAGTPRFDRVSQYQTCDCVVPMRSAKGFCPPAKTQALLSASVDMGAHYPFLGDLQPKNLSETTYRNFGIQIGMKKANPVDFGRRARERRDALGLSQTQVGEASGYSQSNIGWIENGKSKHPDRQALSLAAALRTTPDYLLWGTGQKEVGPPVMTGEQLLESYGRLSLEDRQAISETIVQRVGANKEKRKSG